MKTLNDARTFLVWLERNFSKVVIEKQVSKLCNDEYGRDATRKRNARDLKAFELRKAGLTYKNIGAVLGVSACRANQLASRGECLFNRKHRV